MGEKPWCFDIGTDTLGMLSDIKEAYLNEFENVHSDISSAEWKDIVEPMNLTEMDLKDFEEKPDSAVTGKWWDLKDPNCWVDQKSYVANFDISKEIEELIDILKAFLASAGGIDITTGEQILLVTPELYDNITDLIQDGWEFDIFADLQSRIKIISEEVFGLSQNVSISDTPLTKADSIVFNIQNKLSQLATCQPITYFKDEYTKALTKLADPFLNDLEQQSELLSAAGAAAATAAAALVGLPGLGVGLAATVAASKLRDAIEKKIQDTLDKIKEEIEEAFADNIIFREQCFLLANLGDLVNYKKEQTKNLFLPYVGSELTNEPLHIQGDAFGFMNKLAIDPSQAQLFELKPHEISSITPHMRFYKVVSDDEGKDVETEITFDTNVTNDLAQYMGEKNKLGEYMRRGGRGLGTGVKSFTFSYHGTDPFSAKKAISAKLSIYATSFTELLRERPGGFKYVDLALKTGRSKIDKLSKIERQNLDKLNFRLKAVVEWTASKESLKLIKTESLKNAIYNSAISIYLTPTIHEFDFDETGAVTFDINYLAYIEDYFANAKFDVFASITNEKTARDLVYDYFREQNCEVTTSDDFAEFRKRDENFISKLNVDSLSSVIEGLRKRQKIYYISTSKEEIQAWLKSPIDNSFMKNISTNHSTDVNVVKQASDAALKIPAGTADDETKDAYRLSLVANSDKRANTAFFYLSDLISVVLKNIDASLEASGKITETAYLEVLEGLNEKAKIRKYIEGRIKEEEGSKLKATQTQFKKLRIILGPMEAYPYSITQTATPAISCTIGDIPISMNYFLDFMAEKVLAKQITQYPLSKFIKDVINDTIRNFLNSDNCFKTNSSQKTSLNSTTILGYNTKSTKRAEDDITALIMEQMNAKSGAASKNCLLASKLPSTAFPIIKVSGPRDQPRSKLSIDKMINYYVFSVGRRYPVENYVGNKAADSSRGIFHYLLGEDRGIVKNIKLDKTTATGLKELRFEQEGYDGLTQLREVYNANVETFLNPQTFPGTYIYVEPKGFDPTATEDLTRFGIGGYYMIVKTTHTIAPGNAETQINAAWVASKGNNKIPDEPDKEIKREEEGSEKVKKCKVQSLKDTVGNRGNPAPMLKLRIDLDEDLQNQVGTSAEVITG
jgi:hypothetical protein